MSESRISEISLLIDQEKIAQAHEAMQEMQNGRQAEAQSSLAPARRAAMLMQVGKLPVDEAIITLENALQSDVIRRDPKASHLHAALIDAWARKRQKERMLAVAEEFPKSVETLVALGRALVGFDEREKAKEIFEEALAKEPGSDIAHLALADLHYILGEFEESKIFLQKVGSESRVYRKACRLRAACAAAKMKHEEEIDAYRQALKNPGDFSDRDKISLAFALAGNEQLDEAEDLLTQLWKESKDEHLPRYARQRLDHLHAAKKREPGEATRVRLQAFPSTTQKWNYCGPATLELCFQYMEMDFRQDEIADAIKGEHGTPMHEICAFLEAHDIEARRIVATPSSLKSAIDHGFPVIVQEEYSNTNHVAVVIGYDDNLGSLIVADPMTHQPNYKSYEWMRQAGDLFGNGAVLVIGRRDKVSDELRETLDECDLGHQVHMEIFDRCSRTIDNHEERISPYEVLHFCQQALAMEPSFKQAWNRQMHTLLDIGGAGNDIWGEYFSKLLHVRSAFPRDEWPHQVQGRQLYSRGRYNEAYIAYLSAHERDERDVSNLCGMADCQFYTGNFKLAEKYYLEALKTDPAYARPSEQLASLYLRMLLESTGSVPEQPFPEEVNDAPDYDDMTLRRRAEHFSEVALSSCSQNPFNHEVAGQLAAQKGKWTEAIAAYSAALDLNPRRQIAATGKLDALIENKSFDDAEKFASALAEDGFPEPELALRRLKVCILQGGDETREDELIRSSLPQVDDADEWLNRAHVPLSREYSTETLSARVRNIVEGLGAEDSLKLDVALHLRSVGQVGHAIELLRPLANEGNMAAQFYGALWLENNFLAQDEGRKWIESVIEARPDVIAAHRSKALYMYAAGEFSAARAELDELLGEEDPYIYELHAMCSTALGDDDSSKKFRRLALEATGDLQAGALQLARFHAYDHRYAEALPLVENNMDIEGNDKLRDDYRELFLFAARQANLIGPHIERVSAWVEDLSHVDLGEELFYLFNEDEKHWPIARKAAEFVSEQKKNEDEKIDWLTNAARCHPPGDTEAADQLAKRCANASQKTALGWAYGFVYEHTEMHRIATEVVEEYPRDFQGMVLMMQSSMRLGKSEEAEHWGKKMLEDYPHEHSGPERLALLYAYQFRNEEATELAQQAAAVAPYCHVALEAHATAMFINGDFAGAKKISEKLVGHNIVAEDEKAMIYLACIGDGKRLKAGIEKKRELQQDTSLYDAFFAYALSVAAKHE